MATNKTTTKKNPSNISEKYARFPFPTRRNAVTDEYIVSNDDLGIGINGKVYKCQHRITKRNCALKILKDSDKARRELIMHKKACENCQYIVEILDVYENMRGTTRSLLIIMERMEGGELFDRIKKRQANPYTERDAARFISMIVQAVAHLHDMDVAHRDLKPENLLFTSKDNDATLKLTDFGFAKEGNNEPQPLLTKCFSEYYVAPEVLSNARYDKACDVWSMGVIMYILLCGYPPFYCTGASQFSAGMKEKIKAGEYEFDEEEWRDVSEEAKSTIKRMLTVDPAQRITVNEILNCSWFTEPASARPIDMSSLRDADNWDQMQAEFAAANNIQRRADDDDDDSQLDIIAPEASRIVKKRAAKKHNVEKK